MEVNPVPNKSSNASIRIVRDSDSEAILAWRNNPDVRKWSRNQEILSKEEHEKWFSAWLMPNHQKGHFFIVENSFSTLGMVRFDSRSLHEYEISIVVDPNHQNQGVARNAIALAAHEIILAEGNFSVLATINRENRLSISLFSKIGFIQTVFNEEFLQFRREYTFQDFN